MDRSLRKLGRTRVFGPSCYLTLCEVGLTVFLTDACRNRYGPFWPEYRAGKANAHEPGPKLEEGGGRREVERHHPIFRSNK